MASPDFRHAFSRFENTDDVAESLKTVVVKIIELDTSRKKVWQESDFWKGLVAEGISISFLTSPCVLEAKEPNSAGCHHIIQSEVKHVFTEQFWPKVLAEPVTGAIIISHLRAMNEALHQLNQRDGIVIILEGDTTPNKNALVLFAYFLSNILGNPHLKDTVYTALTFSEWHVGYAGKVHRVANDIIPESKAGAYFQMCSLPDKSNQSGQYQFIGQGGRALAYRSSWAQELLAKKIGMYWDIWVINELSHKRMSWLKRGLNPSHLAAVCIPSSFEHTPDMTQRFRGSGRLSATAINVAEESAYYMCLDLSGNWGICNRLQTVVLMLQMCSWHRLGLYILWTKNDACPGTFGELFQFNFSSKALKTVPFIKVFDNSASSSWKASLSNTIWNIGGLHAQSNVKDGIKVIADTYKGMSKRSPLGKTIMQLVPHIEACDGSEMWKSIEIQNVILEQAKKYLKTCEQNSAYGKVDTHVAVHVRRGDYKMFNCDKIVNNPSVSYEKQLAVQELWSDADAHVQVLVEKIKNKTRNQKPNQNFKQVKTSTNEEATNQKHFIRELGGCQWYSCFADDKTKYPLTSI